MTHGSLVLQEAFHLLDIVVFTVQKLLRHGCYLTIILMIPMQVLQAFDDTSGVALYHHLGDFGIVLVVHELSS